MEPIEFHEVLAKSPIVGRVEVYRPDGDDLVGYFERNDDAAGDDAWLGFVPVPAPAPPSMPLPMCPDCGHLQHSLHLIYGRESGAPSTPCPWSGCGCTG